VREELRKAKIRRLDEHYLAKAQAVHDLHKPGLPVKVTLKEKKWEERGKKQYQEKVPPLETRGRHSPMTKKRQEKFMLTTSGRDAAKPKKLRKKGEGDRGGFLHPPK